ncbi:MAG: bifunctional phosphoribosylaminoimidazolecarboxamide formyltransferase/IMP cyclohydrolase, partial [Clostridium sp.]|nr:bifunctional phosphoribosylaminoimidazolecarboxamide formyltransferase/IMP cyclohydrolase [Clostridium sp.]
IYQAYRKAFEADPVSIFGGIIASNRIIDVPTAKDINSIFIEVVVAPDYDKEALEILRQKKNIRLLKIHELSIPSKSEGMLDMKRVKGGFVIQEVDKGKINPEDLTVVTNRKPTAKEMEDLLFGWTVVKHVKSNAIVLAQDEQTVGIGPGQTNRIWAAQNAIRQAGDKAKGSVLASDAFFPFPDVVEAAEKSGITAIIQPGGSIRDEESIKVADKANIAMVFTGMRHFKH